MNGTSLLVAVLPLVVACSSSSAAPGAGAGGAAGGSPPVSNAGAVAYGGGGTGGGAGAGGSAAAGGTASSSGGATKGPDMLSLELPVERGDKWVLEFGATYFEVTPGHGARITSLRCDGQELLMQHGADNFEDALGSTFWPSPQSWPWPPPPELDTLPYAVQGDGAAGMLLKSEPHAGTQLALQKRFRADLLREAVVLDYTLTNVGSEPSQWAPWEITRMPSDGLAFWPTGGAPSGDSPAVSSALGHTWWQAADTEGEGKLFADGAGGYLAYVTSGCILIKRFQDQPASAAAPGEAEIELYVNGEHSYVEVENQGAYASLAPGASLSWQVTWYVRKLPAGMSPAPGNADLIAFVSETLQ